MNKNIILASGSKARAQMLQNAGYNFAISPTNIDEQSLISVAVEKKERFEQIAMYLAEEKALAHEQKENAYIIGSDQLLIFNNRIYSKSENRDAARTKLLEMQEQSHQLISGVSVVKNGETLWRDYDIVTLTMKKLSAEQIDTYLDAAPDDALQCVGGYAIEGRGARLFNHVEGDFFTIMGMPLLKLIKFFDGEGIS